MSAAATEPISPELVLVCPELRASALAALPDPVVASPAVRTPEIAVVLGYLVVRLVGLVLTSLVWVTLLALAVTLPLLR